MPAKERIATFDNDGTLWCEQPNYVQAAFAFDRAKSMAIQNPSLKEKPGVQAILSNDRAAMASFGKVEIASLIAVTHAGMTPDAFEDVAKAWLTTAEHPRFQRLYKECVYQPQLELLAYLRANGFKLFIVTGGGTDFVRAFSEETYDIPRERVIGSSGKTRFEVRDGKAEVIKLPEIGDIDDGEGKPININLHIGRRPILAFGNSDGDLEMLAYTVTRQGRAALAFGPPRRRGRVNTPTTAIREWGISTKRWTPQPATLDGRQHEERLADDLPARCAEEGRTVNVRQEWRRRMRRFSISKAMALVALIALNFAAIRASMPGRRGHWERVRHLCRRAVASRQRTDRRNFPARVAAP